MGLFLTKYRSGAPLNAEKGWLLNYVLLLGDCPQGFPGI